MRDEREYATGMKDVWVWSLSWYLTPPSSPQKRAKQAELVQAIKEGIHDFEVEQVNAGGAADARFLNDLYCRDSRWCLQLARQKFPRDWPTLGVHASTGAAFGIRYVEMMTGREFDARRPLPRWIGEWACW